MTLENYQALKMVVSKYASARLTKNYRNAYDLTCPNFKKEIPVDQYTAKIGALDQMISEENLPVKDVQPITDKEFLTENHIKTLAELRKLTDVQFSIRTTVLALINGEHSEITALNTEHFSFNGGTWCRESNPNNFQD